MQWWLASEGDDVDSHALGRFTSLTGTRLSDAKVHVESDHQVPSQTSDVAKVNLQDTCNVSIHIRLKHSALHIQRQSSGNHAFLKGSPPLRIQNDFHI